MRRVSQRGKELPVGDIGIFWVYRGRLLPLPTPVHEGEQRAGKRDSPLAHSQEWQRVVRRYRAELPALTVLEYDEVPRGRIVFDEMQSRFIVYMDDMLFTDVDPKKGPRQDVRDALASAFSLHDQQVIFRTDPHYDTRLWGQTVSDDDDPEAP